MKKILTIILLIIFTLTPIKISASTISSGTPYGTYEDAQKMIKESMIDYYTRGTNIQYNNPRATHELPEEATFQDKHYFVCGTFVYQTYRLAFGAGTGMPKYESTIRNGANNYYQNNDPSLIYYYGENGNILYPDGSTSGTMTVSDFAQYIEPGDIFDYNGHVMVAYDKIQKEDGSWDVLMLHSHQENANHQLTGTPIKNYMGVRRGSSSSTSKLSYNTFKNITGANNYLNLDIDDTIEEKEFEEGSVQAFWLSNQMMFVDKYIKTMWCAPGYEPCTVTRLINKDEENNAIFNFDIDTTKYNTTKDIRTVYPGLYIEKTVDKGDNNSVYLGDILTYTIKVKNMSKTNYENSFYIKETINNNLVSFAEDYQNITNNTITFTGPTLEAGAETTFSYKVKVKYVITNKNNIITSTGKFLKTTNDSKYISTGKVENNILAKTNSRKELKSYNTCYEEKKEDYSELDLINEIYKCVWNIDYNFNSFNIYSIFNEINLTSTSSSSILLKITNNPSIFKDMILNNYYSVFKHANDFYHHLHWNEAGTKTSVQGKRQKEIKKIDLKDGDILIYESHNSEYNNEDGVYAYIYLDGEFKGINHKDSENERNSFTYEYYIDESDETSLNNLYTGYSKLNENNRNTILEYINYQTLFDKDYYVILRPEQIMENNYYLYDIFNTYRLIQMQKISDIVDRIDTPSIYVYNIYNNLIDSSNYNNNIGTGSRLQFANSETYVSVTGDIDGDGISNTNDVTEAFKILRNKKTYPNNNIKDAVEEATDTVKDENIKINDIAKLYQYTKGKINSLE